MHISSCPDIRKLSYNHLRLLEELLPEVVCYLELAFLAAFFEALFSFSISFFIDLLSLLSRNQWRDLLKNNTKKCCCKTNNEM